MPQLSRNEPVRTCGRALPRTGLRSCFNFPPLQFKL